MKKKYLLAGMLIMLVVTIPVVYCSKGNSGYGNNNTGGTGGTTSSNAVSIKNYSFGPAALQVTAGVTVTWTNNDNVTHTVTADDSSFDSGDIAPGKSYSLKFSTTGTFAYHCKYHSMMNGSVKVVY